MSIKKVYLYLLDKNENQLGFIPREFSLIISSEIDINQTQYNVSILDIVNKTSFNLIKLKIDKSI